MDIERVRVVVIVRCPLCGSWIVGNDYSHHVTAVHLQKRSDRRSRLVELCIRCRVKVIGRLGRGPARDLIDEIESRRQCGQDTTIGFEQFE